MKNYVKRSYQSGKRAYYTYRLWEAIHSRNIDEIKRLVGLGADVSAAHREGEGNCLTAAIATGDLGLVKLIAELAPDLRDKPVVACDHYWFRLSSNLRYDPVTTPLACALRVGREDIANFLWIECDVNVNQCYCGMGSLLHVAAYSGQLDIVKWLIKRGANVFLKNSKDKKPSEVVSQVIPNMEFYFKDRERQLFRTFEELTEREHKLNPPEEEKEQPVRHTRDITKKLKIKIQSLNEEKASNIDDTSVVTQSNQVHIHKDVEHDAPQSLQGVKGFTH